MLPEDDHDRFLKAVQTACVKVDNADDEDNADSDDMADVKVFNFVHSKCVQQVRFKVASPICTCSRPGCNDNKKYWASILFYTFKNAAPSDHLKFPTITAVARTLEMDEDAVTAMLEDVKEEVMCDMDVEE